MASIAPGRQAVFSPVELALEEPRDGPAWVIDVAGPAMD